MSPGLAAFLTAAAAAVAATPGAAAPSDTGALEALAQRTATVAAPHLEPPVALAVSADSPAMAEAFATLLASRLSAQRLSPFAVPSSGDAAEAQARAEGARTLLRLHLSVEGGQLLARGDALGTWVNFWAGRTPTRPPHPAAAVLASVPADEGVLAWRSTPPAAAQGAPRLALAPEPLATFAVPVAALAAGDLEGNGHPEIAALTEDELVVLSSAGRVLARHSLAALAPARTPARDPVGLLQVAGDRRVGFVLGSRSPGEWLDLDLPHGHLSASGTAEELAVCGPAPARLTPGENTFVRTGAEGGETLVACSAWTRRAGAPVLRVFPDGTARLGGQTLKGLGAGSALADLTGAGVPQVVTSLAEPSPDVDQLRVLPPNGGPETRLAVQGSILQVVAADFDGDGADELVLGVRLPDGTSQLRLVRSVRP